jgi:hypothetical protein
MATRWARTTRGWSIALLAGVLTAALHASAGGNFPPLGIVLLAVVLSGLISTALVGRSRSSLRLTASVTASQAAFHSVFTVFGDSSSAATIGQAGYTGHAAQVAHAGHGMMTGTGAASLHTDTAHASGAMLLAHLVAGLGSALLLAHGERAIDTLGRCAYRALRLLVAPLIFAPLPRTVKPGASSATDQRSLPADAFGVLRHRGPPALLRAP